MIIEDPALTPPPMPTRKEDDRLRRLGPDRIVWFVPKGRPAKRGRK